MTTHPGTTDLAYRLGSELGMPNRGPYNARTLLLRYELYLERRGSHLDDVTIERKSLRLLSELATERWNRHLEVMSAAERLALKQADIEDIADYLIECGKAAQIVLGLS